VQCKDGMAPVIGVVGVIGVVDKKGVDGESSV
jgi:hypothetical protein